LTTLCTPGRYRCVSCGSRRWRGPRESCSCGHSVAPHSPRPLAQYVPLSLAHMSALDFYPRPRTGPPLLVSFLAGTVARAPPCRTNPIPSFLLSPTQACTGGAPWRRCSPPSDPLVIRLHATPTTGALHHLLRSPAISATLFASPPFPPLDLK
jgi:hypothetical protein